ncbi:MAG TPA: NAD(P)-dependent oxidoreductase [Gammaproteobacteria bacterium]|nr:NAD(P)-dependent oxidoreductase [Gammaproteobacteria bacterium]
MNILITGGTGFIGSRLALFCRQQGDSVHVLGQANTPSEEDNIEALRAAGVVVDLVAVDQMGQYSHWFDGVELVVHLAAAQHEANVADAHFRNVNIEGTRSVLDAAVQARVKQFVHGSSIGVYGILDGVIDEQSALNPDNIYGVTKRDGEQLALSYADRLPLVVVRISETYGPGDRRLLKLFKAINKGMFFVIGNGENLHHLIYVEDLIRGILKAADTPAACGEVFVMPGPDPVSTRQMADAIATTLGKTVPHLHAPLWPFLLAATVLEKTLRPLGIQPPLHRRRMDFFRKSFTFSPTKTQELLSFTPQVGFSEGARLTARWYQEQGLLD